MGILSGKTYLTGENGVLTPGDKFTLHNAKIAGTIRIGNEDREEAKLLISIDGGEQQVVFTSGAAIVNQVKQIDAADAQAMRNGGLELMLGTKATNKGNPMYLFVDPNGPVEQSTDATTVGTTTDF